MDKAAQDILAICRLTAERDYLGRLRLLCLRTGLTEAVRSHNTPALFDWLMESVSYQGVSDAIAARYMHEHGRIAFRDIDQALRSCPSCPRLTSYWHFSECRFAKTTHTCSEPAHISLCPLPTHDLRNGRLNQSAYALFLFLRDVCEGDLVSWIDARLTAADKPGTEDRAVRMRQALLEPLACIHGISFKVLSMAFADLLLGADPNRERWITTGANMIAVDTLVHNFLHRTGALHRLRADHAYGPGCYAAGGCAKIIEEVAERIDARQFCPEGPATFPRLIQKAIWDFCAEGGLAICNGNNVDDSQACEQCGCPLFSSCERIVLQPGRRSPKYQTS